MSPATIRVEDLVIVLVDVQPYFLDSMCGDPEPLLLRLEQLLILAEWFDLPVLATLENPVERKGRLPQRLQRLFPESGRIFSKWHYNLCADPEIRKTIEEMSRTQFAVAGGETDVCVLQSVLGLRQNAGDVFLLEDCLFSSEPFVAPALRRMSRAGAIPCTAKTLFYELCGSDDPARWADRRATAVARGFVPFESLPPVRNME